MDGGFETEYVSGVELQRFSPPHLKHSQINRSKSTPGQQQHLFFSHLGKSDHYPFLDTP